MYFLTPDICVIFERPKDIYTGSDTKYNNKQQKQTNEAKPQQKSILQMILPKQNTQDIEKQTQTPILQTDIPPSSPRIQQKKLPYLHRSRPPIRNSSFSYPYQQYKPMSTRCQVYKLQNNQLIQMDLKYKFSGQIIQIQFYQNFCCCLYKTLTNQIFIELLEFDNQDFKIVSKLPIKIIDVTMKIEMIFNQQFSPCAVLTQGNNIVIINFVRYEVFIVALPETDEEREKRITLYRQMQSFEDSDKYLVDTAQMMQNINITFVSGAVVISKQLLDKNKYYTITIAVNPVYKTNILFTNINNLCSYDQDEFLQFISLASTINIEQNDKTSLQQKIFNTKMYIANYFSKNSINFYKPLQQQTFISPYNFIPQSFIQILNEQKQDQNTDFNYEQTNQIIDLDRVQEIISQMQKKGFLKANLVLQSSDDSQLNSQLQTMQLNSILADASQSIMYSKVFQDVQQPQIKFSPQRIKVFDQLSTSQSYADVDKQDLAFKYLRPLEQDQISDNTIEKINNIFKHIPFSKLIDYRDAQQRYQQFFYNNEIYLYDFLKQSILLVQYETSPLYLDNSTNILQFYVQCPYSYSQMLQYQQIKQQLYFSTLFQSNFLSSTSMCQSMSNEYFLQQIASLCTYQGVNIELITNLIASRSIVNIYQAMQSYNLKLLKQFCQQIKNILQQANEVQKSCFTQNQVQPTSITKMINNDENSLEAADFQCQYLPQNDGVLFDLDQMGTSQEIEQQKQSLIFKCQKLKAEFKQRTYQPYKDSVNSNIKRYKVKQNDQMDIYDTKLQIKTDTPLYEAFYKLFTKFCQITNQSVSKEMINIFYSILASSISNAIELFSFGLKQIYTQQIQQESGFSFTFFQVLMFLSEFVENVQLTVGNSYRTLLDIVIRNTHCQKLYEQMFSQSIL